MGAGSVERPRSLHRYSYALNNPNKYHDPNGEILDTILDIGFIAYDVPPAAGLPCASLPTPTTSSTGSAWRTVGSMR